MMRNGNKVAFPERTKQHGQANGNKKSEDHNQDKAKPSDNKGAPSEPPKDINTMSRIELLRAGLASKIQNNLQECNNSIGNDELKTDTKGSFKDSKKKVMF